MSKKQCANCHNDLPRVGKFYWTYDYDRICVRCFNRGYKTGVNPETDLMEYAPRRSGYVSIA